jgi:hypothetical protein
MERASILVESGDTIAAEHLYFSYPQNPERPHTPDRRHYLEHPTASLGS